MFPHCFSTSWQNIAMVLQDLKTALKTLHRGVCVINVGPCLLRKKRFAAESNRKIVYPTVLTSNSWFWNQQWLHLRSVIEMMYSHSKMTGIECGPCVMVPIGSTCYGRMGTLDELTDGWYPLAVCGKFGTNIHHHLGSIQAMNQTELLSYFD